MDKDTFIATLIHDLRTPAYAQMNMLNLFLDGHFGNLSKLQTDKINLMRESCKYSVDLISNILDSYRYSCGNVKLNVESFDIIELISNLKISMLNLAEEKSQRLVFKKNINSCYIMADRLQIKRVLINILSNALKYGF
ncbi:MAG: HAMP domain-containing histidine kinase, partial [Candidatus Gastranaerophilales bacterium]|nr:HAMP domain-containing histidine kinase [Candidatus Gastranaerophilales bacterium]